MSTNPESRWFWNDWDNDRGLQLCGLAAQGLWMRMLSIAAREGGYVRVGKVPCSTEDIARIVGHPVEEVAPLIAELEARRVFSRTRSGCIYNRRQVRDTKIAARRRANGRLGGNPKLLASPRKQPQKSAMDNLDDNLVVKSHAREVPIVPIDPKKEREDSEASLLPAKGPAADPVKEVFDRGVKMLGKDRRSLLGKFCKSHGEVAVLEALIACETECPVDPASFFIACMSRAPPKNGNGKHPGTYRPGPGAAMMEGGYNAAEEYIAKHGLSEAGFELDHAAPQPLLDRERTGGDAPGADRGLDRRPR